MTTPDCGDATNLVFDGVPRWQGRFEMKLVLLGRLLQRAGGKWRRRVAARRSGRVADGRWLGLFLVGLSLVASLGATATRAYGEGAGQPSSSQSAAASALFDEALRLMKDGHFGDACPRLEESEKLEPAVGTLLYLGNCYEQTSRPATAWATYRSAAEAARSAGQPERENTARERAAALEALVPRIVIVVTPEARTTGLVVRRDGVELGEGSWGVGAPVDPGAHLVEASAPGKKTFARTVKIPATNATITVTVPQLEAADPGGNGPPASERTATSPTLSRPKTSPGAPGHPAPVGVEGASARHDRDATGEGESPSTGAAQRIAGGVIGGVGVVGLVVGIVEGLRAKAIEKDSEAFCDAPTFTVCSQDGLDKLDEAHSSLLVSQVAFVAGSVLAAGGLVIILTAPTAPEPSSSASHPETRWVLAPVGGPAQAGLAAQARW